jgi:transcriptional regulator with XRE-family HTH domain
MTKHEIRAARKRDNKAGLAFMLERVPLARRLPVAFAITGIQQQDVADEVGMTDATLSRTVAGRRAPSDNERKALAKAFGVAVCDLFGQEVAA